MTFEEMWSNVKGIPSDASKQIPSVLSDKTKNKIRNLEPKLVAKIVNEAIDEINNGSIERIDVLIRRRL